MVYINNGEHDNPHIYTHIDLGNNLPKEMQNSEYIYEHFQDCEKVHKSDPDMVIQDSNNTIYPHINNDIEYDLFENVIDSYYLDSQTKDGFTCNKTCYTSNDTNNAIETTPQCTHI